MARKKSPRNDINWDAIRKNVDYSMRVTHAQEPQTRTNEMMQHDAAKLAADAHKSPSLFQRAIDVLSRGNYMAANAYQKRAENAMESGGNISGWERFNMLPFSPGFYVNSVANIATDGGDEWKAAWEGLSGKKKTTFADVLDTSNPGMGNKTKAALGLGLDVLVDPTTWIGPGAVGKVAKLSRISKGGKAVEDAENVVSHVVDDVVDAPRPSGIGNIGERKAAAEGKLFPDANYRVPAAAPVEEAARVADTGIPGQLDLFDQAPEAAKLGKDVVAKSEPTLPGMTIKELGGRRRVAPQELDNILNDIHPMESVDVLLPVKTVVRKGGKAAGKTVEDIGKLPPIGVESIKRLPKMAQLAGHSIDELFDEAGNVTKKGQEAVAKVRADRMEKGAVESPDYEAYRQLYSSQMGANPAGWPRAIDDAEGFFGKKGAFGDIIREDAGSGVNKSMRFKIPGKGTQYVYATPKEVAALLIKGEKFEGFDPRLTFKHPITGKNTNFDDYLKELEDAKAEFNPDIAKDVQWDPHTIEGELRNEHFSSAVNGAARKQVEDFVEAGRAAGFSDELLTYIAATVADSRPGAALGRFGPKHVMEQISKYEAEHADELATLTDEEAVKALTKLSDEFQKAAKTQHEKDAVDFINKLIKAHVKPEVILEVFKVHTAQQMSLFTDKALATGAAKTGQYAKQAGKKGNAFSNIAAALDHSPVGDEIAVAAAKKDPELAEQMMNPLTKESDLHADDVVPLSEIEDGITSKHLQNQVENAKNNKYNSRTFNPARLQNAARAALEDYSKEVKFVDGFNLEDQRKMTLGASPSPARLKSYNAMVAAENKVYARLLKGIEDKAFEMGFPPRWFGKDGAIVRLSDAVANIDPKAFKAANGGKEMRYTDIVHYAARKDRAAWNKLVEENPALAQLMDDGRRASLLRDAVVTDQVAEASAQAVRDVHTTPAAAAQQAKESKVAGKEALEEADVQNTQRAADKVDSTVDEAAPPKLGDEESTGRATFEGTRDAAATSNRAQKDSPTTMEAQAAAETPNGKFWAATQDGFDKAVSSILSTRYRIKGLRSAELRAIGVAHRLAAIRASNLVFIKNNFTVEEVTHGWEVARGANTVTEGATGVSDAAQAMRTEIEWVLGSSSIDRSAVKGTATIVAQGIDMRTLNRYLARTDYAEKFQFTNGKKLINGKTVDYSGEGNWLNSWESFEGEPLEFIHHLNVAVEQASVERSLYTTLLHDFGSSSKTATHTHTVDHPFLNGVYFDKETADAVSKMSEHIDKFYKGTESDALRTFDQMLSIWKTSVTIYMPSHHIRNLIGDGYFAWMDGVTNPKHYKNATKILRANKIHYSDMAETAGQKLDERRAFMDAYAHGRVPTEADLAAAGPGLEDVVATLKLKNGKKLPITAKQAHIMMSDHGILPHANVLEDIPGEWSGAGSITDKFQPFGGKVGRGVRKVSEGREHYVRMAHWLHAMEDGKYASLDEALIKSAARVRKWHPDGTDLTQFERKFMRRVIPFYSWQRKAIPLIVESAVRNPGKTSVYFKLQHNAQVANGIEGTSPGQPFPLDQEFPSWIRAIGIGPVFGSPGGYNIINPSNPFIDTGNQYLNQPGRGILSQVNPAARIPLELIMNQDARTGAPLENKTEYLDKQIPGLANFNRVANTDLGFSTLQGWGNGGYTDPYQTEKQKKQGLFDLPAFLNQTFAAGNLDTGEYVKSAQFENREEARKKAEKLRRIMEMNGGQ